MKAFSTANITWTMVGIISLLLFRLIGDIMEWRLMSAMSQMEPPPESLEYSWEEQSQRKTIVGAVTLVLCIWVLVDYRRQVAKWRQMIGPANSSPNHAPGPMTS
jgi:hypothetical protein